uniref:Andersonin-L peptide n=1 Tax=Odorrana andersonii TaxID=369514 RepID=E3SZP5_ODOAN|nr:andersonin-L peptide precursor [Odorrana andersonii]
MFTMKKSNIGFAMTIHCFLSLCEEERDAEEEENDKRKEKLKLKCKAPKCYNDKLACT